MKTFVYSPKDIEGVSGEIVLVHPGFDDKYEFAELFAPLHDEEEKKLSKAKEAVKNAKIIRMMVSWSKKFYQSVSIQSGKESYKSFDDLSDAMMDEVLLGVANAVAEKINLSKKK